MEIKELKETFWAIGKKVGKNLDPDTKRHMVLGLIFLKYVTDTSDSADRENIERSGNSITIENSVNNQEYLSYNNFWVPEKGRWLFLQKNTARPDIGLLLDDAIAAIEKLNKSLTDIFPENYSDPAADKVVLGELINLLGNVDSFCRGRKQKELLAEVFEYFLLMSAESKGANHNYFYTPPGVVKLLVQTIAPRNGKIYDGCCGTGDVFVQSQKFIKKRGNANELLAYGQERNPTALKIAKMNLALHNISASLQPGDSFTNDCFPELMADYVLANLFYYPKDQIANRLHDDKRRKYSAPPEENAEYAWLQHFVSKLSPAGTAGIILDKSSADASKGREREIRKNLIESKLIDCMISLPSKLFSNAKADPCIWVLTNNKTNNYYKTTDNQILFIDAGKLGASVNRRNKELTDEDIVLITQTYQRWKNINGDYIDISGFCKAVSAEEVRKNSYSLLPEKYVSSRSVKNVLPALLLIVLLTCVYFAVEKKKLFTASKPKLPDTAVTAQPKIIVYNTDRKIKSGKTVKKEANEPYAAVKDTVAKANNRAVKADTSVAEVKKYSAVIPAEIADKPAETKLPVAKLPVAKPALPAVKSENEIIKYKVNSTAYFYNKPDESTRRKAFITHWNNTYADIRALDEKNDFIYVVFINHLHQTSKGWLRKADLKGIK